MTKVNKTAIEATNDEVPFSPITPEMLAQAGKLGSDSFELDGKIAAIRAQAHDAEQEAWGHVLKATVAFARGLSKVYADAIPDSDAYKLREAILSARMAAMIRQDNKLDEPTAKRRANPMVTNIMHVVKGVVAGKNIPKGENNLATIARSFQQEAKKAELEEALAEAGDDPEMAAKIAAEFEAKTAKAGGRPVGTTKTPEGGPQILTPSNFKGPGVSEQEASEVFAMLEQLQDLSKPQFKAAMVTLHSVLRGITASLADKSDAA